MKEKKEYRMDGRLFASREEIDFYLWCEEAKTAGIIARWSYQPRTFELAPAVKIPEQVRMKTKVKTVERHLLNDCRYTPDFLLLPGERWHLVGKTLYGTGGSIWIDVKGTFAGQYNDGVKFSLLQKWTYDKWRVYINKVIPVHFFEATFVPHRALTGRSGRPRVCYLSCRTLPEFLNTSSTLL